MFSLARVLFIIIARNVIFDEKVFPFASGFPKRFTIIVSESSHSTTIQDYLSSGFLNLNHSFDSVNGASLLIHLSLLSLEMINLQIYLNQL